MISLSQIEQYYPEKLRGFKKNILREYLQYKILEIIFSAPFGGWLEKWEMDRKMKKLAREQSSSFESYFSADVCKGHINKHGENVVKAFAVRLKKATDPQSTV